MDVKKWKQRVLPLFLAAVMVAGSAFAGMPEKVQAAGENEGSLQSRITSGGNNTYLAYNDGADDRGIKNIFRCFCQ